MTNRFELSRTERQVLWAVINGADIAGTKKAKDAIAGLAQHGLITNTPETTPRLRATDKGRAIFD